MVKGEGSFGVVAHVQVQLIAHLTIDIHLDLLVEIKDVVVSRAFGQRRVIHILVLKAEEQLSRTLHFQAHATRAKHFVCWTDIELHVRNIEFAFVIVLHFANLRLPVLSHLFAFAISAILVHGHHVGRRNIHVANTRVHDIVARHWVILHVGGHVVGILQIQTTLWTCQFFVGVCSHSLHLQRSHLHTIVFLPRCDAVLLLRHRHHWQYAQ